MPMLTTAAAWRQTSARTLSGGRPERDANADLRRPLAHRVRQHTVEAERSECQRNDRERAHEHEGEPFPARAAIHDLGHRRRPVDHEFRIQSSHLSAYGTQQLLR